MIQSKKFVPKADSFYCSRPQINTSSYFRQNRKCWNVVLEKRLTLQLSFCQSSKEQKQLWRPSLPKIDCYETYRCFLNPLQVKSGT